MGIGVATLIAVGCGGSASSSEVPCSLDPTCYVNGADGTCAVDPKATCTDGVWTCGPGGVLASGCSPDGGIAPLADAAASDASLPLPSACANLKCGGPCTLGTNCESPGDPCYVQCTARPDGGAVWVCGGC